MTGEPTGALNEAAERLFRSEPVAQLMGPEYAESDSPEDNPRAAEVLGKRADDIPPGSGVIPLDGPPELGYHCPVCPYRAVVEGEFDERLTWSEYRATLWCYVCERDYPSALCLPGDPTRATEVFLDSVDHVAEHRADTVRDRAAAWAAELADAAAVLVSLVGDEDDELVGAPLPTRIAAAYGAATGRAYIAGQRDVLARLDAVALAELLSPRSDDPADPAEYAEQVRVRIVTALGGLA